MKLNNNPALADHNFLYEKALSLKQDRKSNILELAKVLAELQFRSPSQFKNWLDRPDVNSRQAYYLIKIAKSYEGIAIEVDRLNRLGWTKLALIADHVNSSNAEDLIATAEHSTVAQLRKGISEGKRDSKVYSMVLHLDAEQHADVSRALELNGAKKGRRGLSGKEGAISRLARAFLTKSRKPSKS